MPGKGRHSAKWDRCVQKVSAKGSADNPYAVCTAAVGSGKGGSKSGGSRKK